MNEGILNNQMLIFMFKTMKERQCNHYDTIKLYAYFIFNILVT